MQETGNWLHPTFRSQTYMSKPPLKMWATMGLMELTGKSIFWYRFPDALMTTGAMVFLWLISMKLFASPLVALLSALFLLSNKAFMMRHCARTAVQDSTVFLTCTICMYLFLLMLKKKKESPSFKCTGSAGVIGLLSGAAVMSKYVAGFYGLLAGFSFLIFAVPLRTLFKSWRKELLTIAVLTAVPATIWLTYILTHHYDDFYNMFYIEIYHRLIGKGLHNASDRMLYFRRLFIKGDLLPIILIWPATLFWIYRIIRKETEWLFLFAWGLVPVIIFSFLSSKLGWYILPSYPAIALAASAFLIWLFKQRPKNTFLKASYLLIVTIYAIFAAYQTGIKLKANLTSIITPEPRYHAYNVAEELKNHLTTSDTPTKVLFYNPDGSSILKNTPLPDYARIYLLDLLPWSVFFGDSEGLKAGLEEHNPDFLIFPACKFKEYQEISNLVSCDYFDTSITKKSRGSRGKSYIAACRNNCEGLESFQSCSELPEDIIKRKCGKKKKGKARKVDPFDYARTPSLFAPLE